eukprot:4149636-Pyramimonas_sp.AAC.1
MGLTTKGIHKDMFDLWWGPKGLDWTDAHVRAARQVFFDVCELDAQSVFPTREGESWTSGDPKAGPGALAGSGGEEPTEAERKKIGP